MRRAAFGLLCLVLALSIVLPKAGFKIGDVPVTPANVLFAGLILVCGLAFLSGRRIPESDAARLVIITTAYMAVRLVSSAIIGEPIAGWVLGLVASPLIYFAVTGAVRSHQDLALLLKLVPIGYFLVCAYALAQFFLGVNVTTVPGITVNLTDYLEGGPTWYLDKHNQVGDSSKLFSTYQNGNLFGVNLLLLFPVAYAAATRHWRPLALVLFIVVGFLTLSRSVWAGIALSLLALIISSPARNVLAAAGKVLLVIALVISVPAIFLIRPELSARLFSSDIDSLVNLAGRTPNLVALLDSTGGSPLAVLFGPLGMMQYEGSAYEITTAAIYLVSGVVGLVLITAAIVLALTEMIRSARYSPTVRAVILAVSVYLLVSLIEGAFWLPPTALLFWAIIGLGVRAAQLEAATRNVQPLGTSTLLREVSIDARL